MNFLSPFLDVTRMPLSKVYFLCTARLWNSLPIIVQPPLPPTSLTERIGLSNIPRKWGMGKLLKGRGDPKGDSIGKGVAVSVGTFTS